MSEQIMTTTAFHEIIFKLIPTKKVRVKEIDGMFQLIPVQENEDCTIGLRGILAEYDEMSVDKFLERCRADKELDYTEWQRNLFKGNSIEEIHAMATEYEKTRTTRIDK